VRCEFRSLISSSETLCIFSFGQWSICPYIAQDLIAAAFTRHFDFFLYTVDELINCVQEHPKIHVGLRGTPSARNRLPLYLLPRELNKNEKRLGVSKEVRATVNLRKV
jgi:hypothetical protein